MANTKSIGLDLIKKLEEERGSKVIVYCTGDRKPFGARIAEDIVRPLYDHLLNLDFDDKRGKKKIDLFLYSRGGDVSVPWRVASMIREFCAEFNVVVPYKAQSAATLLSLGADNIIMGRKAELGPIDPTLVKTSLVGGDPSPPQAQEIAVEDVNSFLLFVREKANINDQACLAQMVEKLTEEIGSLTLGNVNRQNSHIRLVARKLLTTRNEKIDEEKINSIIETLTEKIYSHGHGIARKEAKDIGLPVIYADKIEDLIWQLFLKYEEFLKLNDPVHPEIELGQEEEKTLKDLSVAVIESIQKLHIHKTHAELKKLRKVPPSPQINFQMNLQLLSKY